MKRLLFFLALLVTIALGALFVAPKAELVIAQGPQATPSNTPRYIQVFDEEGNESAIFVESIEEFDANIHTHQNNQKGGANCTDIANFSAPTLLEPANRSSLSTLIPLYKWDIATDMNVTDMELYLDVASDQNFTQYVMGFRTSYGWTDSTIRDFRFSHNLDANTTYYWRARLRCEETETDGPFSETFSFTTGSNGTILPASSLIAPANGSQVPANAVQWQWSAVDGSVEYALSWRDAGSNGRTWRWVSGTESAIGYSLNVGTTYDWSVAARNDYAIGTDSDTWQFTTSETITPTNTPIPTATATNAVTVTATSTNVATVTPTSTNAAATNTPTSTNVAATNTPTSTNAAATNTPTSTNAATVTPTSTNPAASNTPTIIATPSNTPANSPTPVPAVASFPFYDGFESSRGSINPSNRVPDTLGAGWSGFFTGQGEIAVSSDAAYGGTSGIMLHDLVRDENASTSALILTIDLAGESNVGLDFWWREFNDENHATDGVFISDNWGGTWHQVLSFNNGPSDFSREQIHLDPYVAANGLSFNDHFQIKFQFYDNHPYPNDGYAIDDISVLPYVPGDPTAPTPVVTDAYENDDSCEEAGTLTTDGMMQAHTFHDAGDEDWLKIEATEGITLVIEARVPPASNADVLLEVYSNCGDNDPSGGQDPSFSEDVRLTLRPPATGTYYIRLLNHDGTVYGNDLGYTLSVREVQTGAAPGALIVVAGRLRENDRVQANIHHVTNAVYEFAREHGCAPSDIYYLAPDMSLDGDGDGLPDVDAQVSKAQLQQAITQWAPDHVGPNEPLTIYLMDHGGEERFYLDGANGEWVTPTELDSWLSELESTIAGLETNIIYEACQSGSFISQPQSISGPRRLVMTSTGQWSLAYASQEGAIFSDSFIDALAQGMNLEAAFSEGALAANSVHPDQSAWLDDNGDGRYTSADGQVAARRAFACTAPPTEQLWAPYIEQASVGNVSQGQALISAQVLDDKNEITQVRAVIYAPSYTQPDSSEEIIAEVPPVILEAQGNGQYSVMSEQFTEAGSYRVLIYADDADGLTSRPQEIIVEVSAQHDVYLPILSR